jgi:hypothetical protein
LVCSLRPYGADPALRRRRAAVSCLVIQLGVDMLTRRQALLTIVAVPWIGMASVRPAKAQGYEFLVFVLKEMGKGAIAAVGGKIFSSILGWDNRKDPASPEQVEEIVRAAVAELKAYISETLTGLEIDRATADLRALVRDMRDYEMAGGAFRLRHATIYANDLIEQCLRFDMKAFFLMPIAVTVKLYAQVYYAKETENEKELEVARADIAEFATRLKVQEKQLLDEMNERERLLSPVETVVGRYDEVLNSRHTVGACTTRFAYMHKNNPIGGFIVNGRCDAEPQSQVWHDQIAGENRVAREKLEAYLAQLHKLQGEWSTAIKNAEAWFA